MASLVRWVHRRLLLTYGRPTCESAYAPLDELVGTILSQHTSDVNSKRAFASLRSRFAAWEAVRDAPLNELTEAIHSGGLAVVKAQRIQAVLRALTSADGRIDLPDLRRMRRRHALDLLLALPGVGRKTAACVLLFGAHVPAPPVDTHVHRVSLRLGVVPPRTTPEATTDVLESALDTSEYYAFHINLIRLGREICRAPHPRCEVCPLRERCATGQLTSIGDCAMAGETATQRMNWQENSSHKPHTAVRIFVQSVDGAAASRRPVPSSTASGQPGPGESHD